MNEKDWLIIWATLAGPIFAVQAQKWVELLRERRNRKAWVFHTLMSSRADRLSVQHVQALNMIDLAFYGSVNFGKCFRSKKEQAVLDAWKVYLDHLNTPFDDKSASVWQSHLEDYFVELLYCISKDLGFSFDKVQIKKGCYSPLYHGNTAQEFADLRRLGVEVLSGRRPIKMDVVGVPQVQQQPPAVTAETPHK